MAGSSVCGSAGMAKVIAPLGAAADRAAGAVVAAGTGAAGAIVGAAAGGAVGLAPAGGAVGADVGGAAGAAPWHAVSRATSTRLAQRVIEMRVLITAPPFLSLRHLGGAPASDAGGRPA